jgi:hypothetical protein
MKITPTINLKDHILEIENKIDRLIFLLYKVRNIGSARLRLNLFKMLILPKYKLVCGGYKFMSRSDW